MIKNTHFGFKNVDIAEKVKLVKNVFDEVSSKYDLMNDLMSVGTHRLWKKEFVKMLKPNSSKTLLDVGGGTADIALDFLNQGGKKAIVLDINQNMLLQGKEKSLNHGYVSSIAFICADAEKLPFKDDSMDCYSTAFCLRNVTNIENALKEAYRVLKPKAKFFCLEFSNVDNEVIGKFYDVWSFNVIPKIGKYVANNEDAYRYLVESIRKFPKQEEFSNLIQQAGFKNVTYKNLTFGVASIHCGEK